MSVLGWPTLLAALASAFAGAALLDFAQLPRRRAGGRGSMGGRRAMGRRGGPLARWAATAVSDDRTERALDAAGRAAIPDAAALVARRRISASVGGAWGGAAALVVAPPAVALVMGVVGGLAGRALPDVALRRAGRHRAALLRDETPELLDLLAVAFGCGLPLRAALAAAGRWTDGELSRGVARAAAELERGAGTGPTLDRLMREHPVAELDAAVAILERSRLHGTPAAAPLRALASGARHARARRAMEHAARAAPRVQLVAALLLVPAALCVLAASLIAGGFSS